MICTRCGARNTDTARFCKKCGNRLEPQRPAQGRKKGIIIGFIAAMILIACGGVYIYAGKVCSPEASLDRMLDRLAKRDVMGAFGECVFTPEEQASIDRALYSGDIDNMVPDNISEVLTSSFVRFEKVYESGPYLDTETMRQAKDVSFNASIAGPYGSNVDIVTMTFVESSDKFLGIFPKWKMTGSSLDDFLY